MTALTRFVLAHKRLVLVFWLVVTVGAFAAVQPAGNALSQQFGVPGGEGYETNQELAELYGNGGDVAPLVPVVHLPPGTTVDSPGVTAAARRGAGEGRGGAARGPHRVLCVDRRPGVRLRRRAHHLRARLHPGQGRRRSRPGGGRRRRPRWPASPSAAPPSRSPASTPCAPRRRDDGGGTGVLRGDPVGALGALLVLDLRLPLVHGARAAADGDRRDPDDLPARLAAGERHRRLRDRAVPRRADRARHRDRLRAARGGPLARGAPAAERDERRRRCATRCGTPARPSSSAARPSRSRCSRSSPCPCRSCAASASPGC